MDNLAKHSRLPRKLANAQEPSPARISKRGRPVAPEVRMAILEDAKELIPQNWTLASIAKKHGIHKSTLAYWLSALGDEYQEIRQAWIDNMLTEASRNLDDAQDPFALAKSREQLKRAMWYAERRDRNRYGENKQQINVAVVPNMTIMLSETPSRVIDAEKTDS